MIYSQSRGLLRIEVYDLWRLVFNSGFNIQDPAPNSLFSASRFTRKVLDTLGQPARLMMAFHVPAFDLVIVAMCTPRIS